MSVTQHFTLGVVALACVTAVNAGDPWRRHTIDDSSQGADGVRLADVNGDGRLDIATGWEEGGVIRVYTHPGPKRVRDNWPAVTVGRVKSPEDAVLVDLDGDRHVDVVSSCEGRTRTVFFHWSPQDTTRALDSSAWTTEAVPATANQQMWMYALPVDVDGRHGVDLIVGSKGPQASISWLESPESPRQVSQWQLHRLREAGWIMSLVLEDLDRDGDPDLVFSDRKGARSGIGWLENPGPAAARGGLKWVEHPIGLDGQEVMFLALLDWNRDRTTDLIAAVSKGPCALLVQQPADRSWVGREIPLPAGCGIGKSAAAGDIDRDGQLDVVFSCEGARGQLSGVRWLSAPRDGSDRWRDQEISGPDGEKYDRLELLDLDDDGDLDVLTCEERDNLGVIWYENPL